MDWVCGFFFLRWFAAVSALVVFFERGLVGCPCGMVTFWYGGLFAWNCVMHFGWVG